MVGEGKSRIEALLQENRRFAPSDAFRKGANVNDPGIYEVARKDPEGWWAAQAENFTWFRKWDRVLEWDPPYAKWFVHATTNITVNCLDRHLSSWRRNKAAFLW
ncbi:MAG: acetyl-coenzyme A synthetase, partial [Deltaproteobacteria bacterium]